MKYFARLFLLPLAALAQWTEPVHVRQELKPCISYRAKLAGDYLLVEATLDSGWKTFAMDNQKRADEKLAGKKALGIDRETSIDLAGGANMVGSNVLIGGPGGPLDFLSTAGYGKLGLPGDMLPGMTNVTTGTSFTNSRLGLAFHSDSAFLRGILDRIAPATAASINGAVIAARSENDTGNNPHNPMYGIHQAGADGALATLIGSRPSDSGGNSMAPAGLIDLSVRPTKVDRASDVTSLVDTGQLASLLSLDDTVAVMEAIQRISARKLQNIDPKQPWADPKKTTVTRNEVVKELVNCGYVKAADAVDQYGDPSSLNPDLDPDIVGAGGIFSRAEYDGDDEFRKTAAVMKMVLSGYAGAGTIALGTEIGIAHV